MSYPALRYEQPGGVFYACVIPAEKIVNNLQIQRRRDDPSSGVQRDEDTARVKNITSYLNGDDAVLPTPIIISANDNVSIEDGLLHLQAGAASYGHILDGQHRVLGLRELSGDRLSLIELLVVFVFEIDVYSEATIFATINSNQKQVSKSLIYDLFALDPNWSQAKAGHEIVKSLNDDPESPFFQRIKMLGKKVEMTETLSQAAFIDRLIEAARSSSNGINVYLKPGEEWSVRKIISNAFSGIQSAVKTNGHNYPEDYFFRTNGYGGVMKALNSLVEKGREQGSLEPAFFEGIFVKMLSKFPDPPEGTGNSAQLAVRDRVLQVLIE